MANALPQAIEAQTAYPGRQVISLSGDGGLAMLLGELLTIAQCQLPVKIVLFNNHRLGMVQLEQEAAGLPHYGCELKNPNFAALAEAVGLRGLRVEDPMKVRPALETALGSTSPVLVDIVTDPNVLSMPPKATIEQASHKSPFRSTDLISGAFTKIARRLGSPCVIVRLKWVMRTMTKTGWLDNVQD